MIMMRLKETLVKFKKQKKNVDREKLIYRASEYTYDFRNFKTIRTFGRNIYEGKISLEKADEDQLNLMNEIRIFNAKTCIIFFDTREKILSGFESKIFLTKSTRTGILNTVNSKLKILTSKQMLQRLPIALAQVKVVNNSKNLLNEIR